MLTHKKDYIYKHMYKAQVAMNFQQFMFPTFDPNNHTKSL